MNEKWLTYLEKFSTIVGPTNSFGLSEQSNAIFPSRPFWIVMTVLLMLLRGMTTIQLTYQNLDFLPTIRFTSPTISDAKKK